MLEDTHGYVVSAISVWLLWKRRAAIEVVDAEPSWQFIIATAVLSFIWYLAWISGLEIGYQVLFPFVLFGAVIGAIGPRGARALALPLGVFCFVDPIVMLMGYPLRLASMLGVTALIELSGLSTYIEGNTIYLPGGAIEVSTICSGISYVTVSLLIAALYGEMNRNRLRHRVLLLALAAAVAIGMNSVRIYGIVLNGYLTGMTGYLVAVEHDTWGWVMFGVTLVAFFWLARRMVPVGTAAGGGAVSTDVPGRGSVVGLPAAVMALAIGPLLTLIADHRIGTDPGVSVTLPLGAGGWVGPGRAGQQWIPSFPQADADAIAEYEHEGSRVSAYVNAYGYQSQGHELVSRGNDLLGDRRWQVQDSRTIGARPNSEDVPYVELSAVTPGRQRWVIGYFYVTDGRILTRAITSKLFYGLAALRGQPQSGIVAVAAACSSDCASERKIVSDFMLSNGRALAGVIQGSREAT